MIHHVKSIENLLNVPVPGTPESDRTTKSPKLIHSFIPASIQVLQHCIISIQYEPQSTTTTTTTEKTMTTTISATVKPTSFHKPGYFGPEKPPETVPVSISSSTSQLMLETTTETGEALLWNDKQFFEWFLQSKYKQINLENDFRLQLLDPLPLRLLKDIDNERYELSALLDKDNVNEFRKVYDDQYRADVLGLFSSISENKPNYQVSDRSPGMNGSRKRVPPTKPYIHMLMLYDVLKREAKKNMFHLYEGYSSDILAELVSANPDNGQQQLLFVLSRMLQDKNIEKSDVVTRTNAMISDLENEHSAISKALVEITPLKFSQ